MLTRIQRILIASQSSQTGVPEGYMAIFSFRKWFGYSGFCVRLKRVSDDAQQDFGFLGDYLDVGAIQTWANGSELDFLIWYDQLENLVCAPYGFVPPPKFFIENGEAILKTDVGDGMRIGNIPHPNVKVTSAWKNTGTSYNMVGCYNSSLSRLQFTKYNGQWLLGVNTAYVFRSATVLQLLSRQVVTYNSDDINGQTKIYNHEGVSFTNTGNPTVPTFRLGVGIGDLSGYYGSRGEIYGIIIHHDNALVDEVEQAFISEYL